MMECYAIALTRFAASRFAGFRALAPPQVEYDADRHEDQETADRRLIGQPLIEEDGAKQDRNQAAR